MPETRGAPVDRQRQILIQHYNRTGISSKKCCVVTTGKPHDNHDRSQYYLGAEYITNFDTVSDLGVTIDSHLCFNDHIVKITHKAPNGPI